MAKKHQSEIEPENRRARQLRLWFFGLAATAFVYALSVGPSYKLLRKGVIQQQTFSSLYSPVIRMAEHNRYFERTLDWYLSFWYSDERQLEESLKSLEPSSSK
jgi:hypothetical protein